MRYRFPRLSFLMLLRNEALASGDAEAVAKIRDLYEQHFHQIFLEGDLSLNFGLVTPALDLVPVLQFLGDDAFADRLLRHAEKFAKTGGAAGAAAMMEVHALRGEHESALHYVGALLQLGGFGWRLFIEQNQNLASIHALPAYQAMAANHRQQLSQQLQRLRQSEDPQQTCRQTFAAYSPPA